MAEDTASIAAGLSAATTGESTPSNMTVKRPTRESVMTLLLAMLGSTFLALVLIWAVGPASKWPDVVAGARIMWLGIALCLAVVCTPIIVLALASSRLGKVEASAGENFKIAVDGTAGAAGD